MKDKRIKLQTEQEAREFVEYLIKESKRLVRRFEKNTADNNQASEALIAYITKYPELFFGDREMIENDMFKWALKENIKATQKLLDTIQEKEDEIGFPVIHKY